MEMNEIKEIRELFHKLDKNMAQFIAISTTQHENQEKLIKEHINHNNESNAKNDREFEKLYERQDKLDERQDKVEQGLAEIRSENNAKHRNKNIWLGVGTIAATIMAVIAGILIDKILLGG